MNNKYPLIVSFFTNTWDYPAHASRLMGECKRLGLDYVIEEMEATGSWLGNTRLKPQFINSCMLKYNRPLLWIDVDGSIYKEPEFLLDAVEDFIGRHQRTGPKRTWHVGTMFFNNTEKTKRLLTRWADAARMAQHSDEAAFEQIWLTFEESLAYKELPEEYFVIMPSGQPTAGTVIGHRLSKCPSKMEMKKRNAK